MFEQATRMKLRFFLDQGGMTVEDLWDLPLSKLNQLAKELNRKLKTVEEEDFLEETNQEDKETKLKFNIALHILNTKKEERKDRLNASAKKAEKEKLLSILEQKQNQELEGLSAEEIQKRINEL